MPKFSKLISTFLKFKKVDMSLENLDSNQIIKDLRKISFFGRSQTKIWVIIIPEYVVFIEIKSLLKSAVTMHFFKGKQFIIIKTFLLD